MGEKGKRIRFIATFCYVAFFAIYFIVGFQPVDAINYEISGDLSIPSILLKSDVTTLELQESRLITPANIVGAYSNSENKTLLIGHSTTIFKNLEHITKNSDIFYNQKPYTIKDIQILAKNDIDMTEILSPSDSETIILMTCAGELLDNLDATHRLIITAEIKK